RPADTEHLRPNLARSAPAADAVRPRAGLPRRRDRQDLARRLRAARAARAHRGGRRRLAAAGPRHDVSDLQLRDAARAARGDARMNGMALITQGIEILAAIAAAPLYLGWINQCRAWLQNRRAPSIFQPYRAIRKLFLKDAVIAHNASPLFRVAPYVVFAAMAL